jgi:hypothetical protein
MRAKVHAGGGAGLYRFAQVALGPLLVVLVLLFAKDTAVTDLLPSTIFGDPPFLLLALSGMFALAWPSFVGRKASRTISLRMRASLVELGWGIFPWQRIRSTAVKATSVARATEGVSLIITQKHGSPIFLELEDEEAAQSVETALAMGGAAEGLLSFDAQVPGRKAFPRDTLEVLIRFAGFFLWPAYYLAAMNFISIASVEGKGMFGIPGLGCVALGFLMHLLRPYGRAQLVLEAEGLRLGNSLRVAYRNLDFVEVTGKGVALHMAASVSDAATGPMSPHPNASAAEKKLEILLPRLSAKERAHVATHILAAVHRAKGNEPARASMPGWIAALSRKKDEPARAWFGRLDSMDQDREGDPYRRGALDRNELGQTIRDQEAPAEVRAGAARVLWRLAPEEARRRIAELDARAEPEMVERLRIAVEGDAEEAGDAYEELAPPFRVLER